MGLIVRVAPLGVLGAVAYTVGRYGVGSLKQLLSLVILFWAAVSIFIVVILGTVMRIAGVNIFKFLAYLREELTIVLATASSDAVLPQIMRKLEFMGVKEVGRRPRGADRLFVQPRRLLDLSDAGGRVHRAGDEHAAVVRRSPPGAGRLAPHLEGRAWRAGSAIVILAATLNAVPSIPAIGLVLVLSVDWFRRHGACGGQPRGQLRCDRRRRRLEGDLDLDRATRVLDGSHEAAETAAIG